MANATGRMAMKWTQGSTVQQIDFPAGELQTRVVALVNAGIDPASIFAYQGGNLVIEQVTQVTFTPA